MEKFAIMMHLSFIIKLRRKLMRYRIVLYAENNPVTFSAPSGHAAKSGGLSSLQNNIRIANGGNGPALKPVVNNPTAAAKVIYQSRRDAGQRPDEPRRRFAYLCGKHCGKSGSSEVYGVCSV